MEWMAGTFRGRGIGPDFLRRMCKAWIIAMHGAVGASALTETVPLLERIAAHAEAFFSAPRPEAPVPDSESSAFLGLLLDNRKEDALQAALAHSGRHPVEDTTARLFLHSLEAIGSLWSDNRISVADEHLAAANARWVASRFFASLKRNPAKPHSIAVFSAPGDEHSLGAELLSRYLEFRGWTVLFLGSSIPESELIRAVVKEKPRAAVITVAMIFNLPAFRRTVLGLRHNALGLRILGATSKIAARPVLETLCDGVPATFEECDALLAEGGKSRAS
jgi:methanogenic corrinoid protein MtbC1